MVSLWCFAEELEPLLEIPTPVSDCRTAVKTFACECSHSKRGPEAERSEFDKSHRTEAPAIRLLDRRGSVALMLVHAVGAAAGTCRDGNVWLLQPTCKMSSFATRNGWLSVCSPAAARPMVGLRWDR
jgi:hypothetical protein